jgi:phosphatidate cytidylyltransferase
MSEITLKRFFDYHQAFAEPLVVHIVAVVGIFLAVAPIAILALDKMGRLGPDLRKDLFHRYLALLIMAPVTVAPILLGAAWTIAAVMVLSLLCFREFARAVGFFRERAMSLMVMFGILAVTFSVADHWYRLFVALSPLIIIIMALTAILGDRPIGFIQRVALGILSFTLFGVCLGHLGYFANDTRYRPMLLLLILCAQLNDVFDYGIGKALGGPKLAHQTNPGKTISGAIGALILTTILVAWLSGFLFREGTLHQAPFRIVLGIFVSLAGQLGSLTLSAVQRDVGITDKFVVIPFHGGLLDWANCLLFSAPVLFHYVNYFYPIGFDQPARIFSGGG